jgi:hypothetical protein
MTKKLKDVLSTLSAKRQTKIAGRVAELATLRDLSIAASQTQADMAHTLAVCQDIFRA